MSNQTKWLEVRFAAANPEITLLRGHSALRGETLHGYNHMTMATCFSDPVQEYWDVRIVESNVSPMQIQGSKAPLVVAALFGDWAAYSPRLEKNLSFANVPVGRSKRGDRLTVRTPVGAEALAEGQRAARRLSRRAVGDNRG